MSRLVSSLLSVVIASGFALGCDDPPPDLPDRAAEVESATPPATLDNERGLLLREPGVSDGYVLHAPLLSHAKYLIDNDGLVVHQWRSEFVGHGLYLLDNGNLLSLGRDPTLMGFRSGGVSGYVDEIDWDSKLRWRWHFASEEAVNHHDIEPMANGNVLVIGWETRSREESLGVGRRPELAPTQGLWPDFLLEIEPIRPEGARVVWARISNPISCTSTPWPTMNGSTRS
jgi:hypothetical protein